MTQSSPNAWTSLWETMVRFDSAKVTPWIALRNTVGIALPLALAVAVGNPAAGTIVATGALNVSFSDGSDPYIRRGGRMLIATVVASTAVVVGATVGQYGAFGIVLAAAWAFFAGMLVALDNSAGDIGLISLVTLVVFSAHQMSPEQAIYSGLLALGGGVLQTSLSIALWPVRRHEPEQRLVGDLYLALSGLAASSVKASESPPATGEISQARKMLSGFGRGRSSQAERYWSLLSQAERIRLSLLMIARLRTRLEREPDTGLYTTLIDKGRELAAEILRQTGSELLAGGSSAINPELMRQFMEVVEKHRESGHTGESAQANALIADVQFQLDGLAGQMRSAMDLAAYSTPIGREVFERHQSQKPWRFRVEGGLAILRANLSLRSAAFRHAIRMAVCVGVAAFVARQLDWQRSYWLPMTVAIILKPDFTTTFSRGLLRLVGTGVGLVLATALFHALPLTPAIEIVLLAGFAFVLRCYGPANYGIFVMAVSALVVLLFALTGVSPGEVVLSRALNTAVGGLLAIGIYALWPTWERTQVSDMLAQVLDAYRAYFRAVREGYVHLDQRRPQELDSTRLAARVARTNLEASLERFRAEPGVNAQRVELLGSMLASSHRFAHAVMALEAGLTRSHPVPARSEFVKFANDIERTLHSLAAALRGSRLSADELPDVRAAHQALVHAGDLLTERYALVNVEADRMTNSLNTFSEQLWQWLQDVSFSSPEASSQ